MASALPCPERKPRDEYVHRIVVFDDGNESLTSLPNRWRIIGLGSHNGSLLQGKCVIQNLADITVSRSISCWKLALLTD